jgi:hypothetical protein
MTAEPTCGQGLAEHATLPRLAGALLDAVADNLAAHLPGLIANDPDSQREKRVYEQLAARHRDVAARLEPSARGWPDIRICRWAPTT